MPISSEDLTRRLAEADRRRMALRKATHELSALGQQILKHKNKRERDDVNRPKRPNRGAAGRE